MMLQTRNPMCLLSNPTVLANNITWQMLTQTLRCMCRLTLPVLLTLRYQTLVRVQS